MARFCAELKLTELVSSLYRMGLAVRRARMPSIMFTPTEACVKNHFCKPTKSMTPCGTASSVVTLVWSMTAAAPGAAENPQTRTSSKNRTERAAHDFPFPVRNLPLQRNRPEESPAQGAPLL